MSDTEQQGWKPVDLERNKFFLPPFAVCGHRRRGVRKHYCASCMRAAYPGVPFEEAQRRFLAAHPVDQQEGSTR